MTQMTQSMKPPPGAARSIDVNLDAIPAKGLELELKGEAPTLGLETEDVEFEGPVAVTVRLDRAGTTVAAAGTLSARVRLQCGRCGRDLRLQVRSPFRTAFKPSSESPDGQEVQLTRGDLDVTFYDGASVPLPRLILEQVILATPMRPLCSSDCKGLCLQCGQDLNVAACGCPQEQPGRRLLDRPGT